MSRFWQALNQGLSSLSLVCISFYRLWISPYIPTRCRYYPTCSSYALILFRLSPPLYALFFSIIRILKCNPLSQGGCDHPVIKVRLENLHYSPIKFDYWIVPLKPMRHSMKKSIKIWAYILKKD